LALAQDKVALFGLQLRDFGELVASCADLRRCLTHPALERAERLGVLDTLLARLGLETTLANFLRVVLVRGRFALLASMVASYEGLVDAAAGRVRVRVESATPLTPEQHAWLRALWCRRVGREVVMETALVPELLGGVVVSVGGKVYDSSLARHLARLREAILRG